MGRPKTPPYDRVMQKVRWEGSCLVYTGKRSRNGYGRTSIFLDGKVYEMQATRVVFEHHYGPTDRRLFVLHSCDNPPCVNIEHLRLGTAQDNSDDMVERDRGRKPDLMRRECANGHDLTAPDATFDRPTNKERAKLGCRQCRRDAVHRQRERRTGRPYQGQPWNGDKVDCKRGHPLPASNGARSNQRQCPICARMTPRERYDYDSERGIPIDPRTQRRIEGNP